MILVTGATGFVGGALLRRLARESDPDAVVAVVRRLDALLPEGVRQVQVETLDATTNWGIALEGVSTLVHCAARVHVMQDAAMDALEAYRQVNVRGTLNLARQAADAGVRRFVFVSSIKVNGEFTSPEAPFRPEDAPAPLDAYGVSKWEAEMGLRELSARTGMEVVIVRPPLVYGQGVKGNFAAMMRAVALGVPLPLGAIHNARSMVALDNLVDLLVTCLRHPAAPGQIFLVSDGEDVSTTQLLRRLGTAMNRPARLLPVPAAFLVLAARLLGKKAVAQRLLGSLQVDINRTCELLDWNPPLCVDEGLRRAVEKRV